MLIDHPNRTNKITKQGRIKLTGSEIKRVKKIKLLGIAIYQGPSGDIVIGWEDQLETIKANAC